MTWATPAAPGAQPDQKKASRADFDERAKELKGQVAGRVSSTSAAAERKDQSLLGQVGQQAVDDARSTAREVGQAAEKVLGNLRE
mgnify:CR=1 FL=1